MGSLWKWVALVDDHEVVERLSFGRVAALRVDLRPVDPPVHQADIVFVVLFGKVVHRVVPEGFVLQQLVVVDVTEAIWSGVVSHVTGGIHFRWLLDLEDVVVVLIALFWELGELLGVLVLVVEADVLAHPLALALVDRRERRERGLVVENEVELVGGRAYFLHGGRGPVRNERLDEVANKDQEEEPHEVFNTGHVHNPVSGVDGQVEFHLTIVAELDRLDPLFLVFVLGSKTFAEATEVILLLIVRFKLRVVHAVWSLESFVDLSVETVHIFHRSEDRVARELTMFSAEVGPASVEISSLEWFMDKIAFTHRISF